MGNGCSIVDEAADYILGGGSVDGVIEAIVEGRSLEARGVSQAEARRMQIIAPAVRKSLRKVFSPEVIKRIKPLRAIRKSEMEPKFKIGPIVPRTPEHVHAQNREMLARRRELRRAIEKAPFGERWKEKQLAIHDFIK